MQLTQGLTIVCQVEENHQAEADIDNHGAQADAFHRLFVLKKADIVLECKNIEHGVQHGYDRRDGEQVRIGVQEHVAYHVVPLILLPRERFLLSPILFRLALQLPLPHLRVIADA